MRVVQPVGDTDQVVAKLDTWLHDGDDRRLVVETSGSSGRPKRVVLSRAAVLASVTASQRRLGTAARWVIALPPTYVAGVQVICRSLVAGHEPVEHAGDWTATAERAGVEGAEWCVSLVPTQLHRLLDQRHEVAALTAAHTILLGGGPIDAALRRRADEAGLRVTATYGAAETAGGCVYDGVALDGVAVAIGEQGRIRIAGPTLFDGYLDDPTLTAQTLVDGWFLTSDAGRIDEDGHLQVLGRIDDLVVSGGVNVPTHAVAGRLRAHPEVSDAEVIGVPDPEWGQRVVAFVVLGTASPIDDAGLRDWVSQTHPRSWAPRQVIALRSIPMLENGKPNRMAMREMVGEA